MNTGVGEGSNFSNCDVAIIINMNTGAYERVAISSSTANTVTFYSAPATTYDGTTAPIQLVRAPQFTTVTVSGGHSVTTTAYDGNVGGIIWFYANSTVTISGEINVDGLGATGGSGGALAAGGGAGALGAGSNGNGGDATSCEGR